MSGSWNVSDHGQTCTKRKNTGNSRSPKNNCLEEAEHAPQFAKMNEVIKPTLKENLERCLKVKQRPTGRKKKQPKK